MRMHDLCTLIVFYKSCRKVILELLCPALLSGSQVRLFSMMDLSCQKWNGQKMAPHTTFSRKKWNGVPVLAAKNSTPLPKMELLFILKKVPVLAA